MGFYGANVQKVNSVEGIASAETVSHFTCGAGYVAEILNATGVHSGANMISAL